MIFNKFEDFVPVTYANRQRNYMPQFFGKLVKTRVRPILHIYGQKIAE